MTHRSMSDFSEGIPGAGAGDIARFIRRFETYRPLSPADKGALVEATTAVRDVQAQAILSREGDEPEVVHILLEGFACCYKIVDDGKRQIVGFLVPGDVCDARVFVLGRIDCSVATLTDSRITTIPRAAFDAIYEHRPALTRALLWSSLVNESVSREWLANMGRRTPNKRIGHLLCEMLMRLRAVGLADNDRFAFPITQADLGDTVGLSTVHVNRTLQELKAKRLIASKRWLFEILDVARLINFSGFDPAYLHLEHAAAPVR